MRLRRILGTWGMAVPAGVVGDPGVGTGNALFNVPTERRGAAGLDSRHHAQLDPAEMASLSLAPSLSVAAEDVRHLSLGRGMPGSQAGEAASMFKSSSGLWMRRTVLRATRA